MKPIRTSLFHDALTHPRLAAKPSMPLLRDCTMATLIAGIGFAPISALALSLMGVFTLPVATLVLVMPALAAAVALCRHRRGCARLMRRGFVMGMVAVACYDAVRLPFTMAGWLEDFIPAIGAMLVGEGPHHAIVGYLWRYLGNGGGLGLAFVSAFALLAPHFTTSVPPRTTRWIALGFGAAVWSCLIATLAVSPQGEEVMFVISPLTLLLSLIGHLVFGHTLGCLLTRFPPQDPAGL